ncbi:cytochrome c biogenesis factor N (mitochondrion) [Klebsormidium nitens]|uniref:Cytochrome c biogenesis factor N n=2 Tax=Klebsormidium TaxID=3174 RepID=A0A0U9HL08_KLENI|nr:heme lyase [Klebsormidium flaccidum]GAQ93806.1 cytochrome c biogenesis factor N [Klebsormidium nitens]|eukprot:GAQ93806.1 cytochrome c biogenesis factor N (mitochondrion) [Klebsormidium nitens]
MLIETGHYFLAFSAFLLFTQSSFFLALTAVTLLFSLFCLFVSYACSDFSVINVFINSNHQLPVFYKISGAWSNHEGSMLLWAWILSFFCILFLIRSRLSAQAIHIRPQLVFSCILFYFCIFLFATSNPYLRLLLISPEAMAELNPVLQDPILAIHPPLIYAGYVASAIAFAVCLSICIKSYKTGKDFRSLYKRKDRIQAALKAVSSFSVRLIHSKKGQNVWNKEPLMGLLPPASLKKKVFFFSTLQSPSGSSSSLKKKFFFLSSLQSPSGSGSSLHTFKKCGSSLQSPSERGSSLPEGKWSEEKKLFFEPNETKKRVFFLSAARQPVKAIPLSEAKNQDTIVSGSDLSVIRAYQDWGWKEIRIWTLICWCFLTVGILLGSWWAYHELGWGGWWFWDPVENASFMPWVLSTGLAHSILYAHLRLWTVFFSFAIFLLSLLGTFFVRSGFLASVHSFASDSSRGLFFLIFLTGLVILCTLVFYQFCSYSKRFLEIENKKKIAQAAQQKKGVKKAESFTRIQSLFALIVCTVVLCGTAAPVLFSLIFGRDVSAGAPFFNGTILPISGALLILCIFAQLDNRSFFNILFCLFICVVNTVLAYFIGGLPITESLFFSIAFLLFYTLLWKSRTSMQLAHGGLCAFIAGIIFSNPYKSQATQMLQIGDLFCIDKNTLLILRGIDQLYGPTFQSICANLFVQPNQLGSKTNHFVENNSGFPIFPEKRFYYSQTDSSTTKVAVQTNGFSDVYALIGSGNIETGWYTTVIKLPFIACIWIGFFISSLGGGFSLSKQLKMPHLFWM